MNIYFSGIAGVGIGPLAQIACDLGWGVTGSDSSDLVSTTTKNLLDRGVDISLGDQSGEFLRQVHSQKPLDYFVYTSALPDGHPELLAARELDIKSVKRDQLINFILESTGQKMIAIAGTHGKTTTTAMLVWLLQGLGQPVSYSIGTEITFGTSGKYDPNAKYFIYEADEYDRNFLAFDPDLSVIVAVDFDHPDIYSGQDDYDSAFLGFINQSKMSLIPSGRFLGAHSQQIDSKYQAIELPGKASSAIKLPGLHNRQNAYLALRAAKYIIGDDFDDAHGADILSRFPGTGRRFEMISKGIYSDYAHTPEEVRAALQLAREVAGDSKVIAVYQPHQNSRQQQIVDDGGYGDALDQADEIIWLPTYLTRENPAQEVLTPSDLITSLTKTSQGKANPGEMSDQVLESLLQRAQDGDLLVFMGAGDIHSWITR